MGLATIRKQYGVPAKRGQRLCFTDTDGVKFFCTIKSARDGHLSVLVDDRVPGYRGRMLLHPVWHVEYLTPNALAQGREPHSGEASPGATGSTTPGNHGGRA